MNLPKKLSVQHSSAFQHCQPCQRPGDSESGVWRLGTGGWTHFPAYHPPHVLGIQEPAAQHFCRPSLVAGIADDPGFRKGNFWYRGLWEFWRDLAIQSHVRTTFEAFNALPHACSPTPARGEPVLRTSQVFLLNAWPSCLKLGNAKDLKKSSNLNISFYKYGTLGLETSRLLKVMGRAQLSIAWSDALSLMSLPSADRSRRNLGEQC